ncbi:hypothetical protein [Paracoccus cavernae]|uniref:hypothetical protein n=1 Tax=Paracoccus cavernae TaxID=1571207 RepID=UPI0035F23394
MDRIIMRWKLTAAPIGPVAALLPEFSGDLVGPHPAPWSEGRDSAKLPGKASHANFITTPGKWTNFVRVKQ